MNQIVVKFLFATKKLFFSARLYLSRADPSSGPEIVRAQVGERLQLNCAAGNSHPAAKITWYG